MKSLVNTFYAILIAVSINTLDSKADGGIQIPKSATLEFQKWVSNEGSLGIFMEMTLTGALSVFYTQSNFDFKCSTVYQKWIRQDVRGGDTTVTVQAWCEPRSLVQKQIMSMYKMCETSPKEICYTKEYLDYLSKYEKTNYLDIDKPDFKKIPAKRRF